jgi:hypothetical protein
MRYFHQVCAAVIGAVALLIGGEALGDEGISLHITNDGTGDLYVTVTDANSRTPIIEHQRLNGFATLPVTASADDQGRANITWTTISVDNSDRHCGRGNNTGLQTDATVSVHADSSCGS